MSSAINCAEQFDLNGVAAYLAIVVLAVTFFVYIWNIGHVLIEYIYFQEDVPRKPSHERYDLNVNALSGLLCAITGLDLIFGTWPQPLEAAAILVVVLAQASALGWQALDTMRERHRRLGSFLEKLPDVFGVVVAAYALGDATTKYKLATGNGFSGDHDPDDQMIIAYVLTGAASLVGIAELVFFALAWDGKLFLIGSSFFYFIIQLCATVATIIYTMTTTAEGCKLFNGSKFCAIVALCLGTTYSLSLFVLRHRSSRA